MRTKLLPLGRAVGGPLTADGGGSGIYTAPCYELVGPLLCGAHISTD